MPKKLSERAKIRTLRAYLRAIRDFKTIEITYDEFAYDRMVNAYRKAASDGLAYVWVDYRQRTNRQFAAFCRAQAAKLKRKV